MAPPDDSSGPSSSSAAVKKKNKNKPAAVKKKLVVLPPATTTTTSSSQTTSTTKVVKKNKKNSLESSIASLSADDLLNNEAPKKKKVKNQSHNKLMVDSKAAAGQDSASSSLNASISKGSSNISVGKKTKAAPSSASKKIPVPLPPAGTPVKKKNPPKKQAADKKTTTTTTATTTTTTSSGRISPKSNNNIAEDDAAAAAAAAAAPKISPKSPQKKTMSKFLSPKTTTPVNKRPTLGQRAQSIPNLSSPTKQLASPKRTIGKLLNNSSSSGGGGGGGGISRPESPRVPRRGTRLGFESMRESYLQNASTTQSSNIKKPNIGRQLPSRAKSSDLEVLGSAQRKQPPLPLTGSSSSSSRRQVVRSKSGDLECLAGSSMHDRTDIPTPPSILRNSTHNGGPGILKNSSHHVPGTMTTSTPTRTRFGGASSDDDDDSSYSIDEETIKFDDDPKPPAKPRSARPGLGGGRPGLPAKSKSLSSFSGHNFSKSTRSIMSTDDEIVHYPDDKRWQKVLRYIRILPPYPNEKLEKKRIRQYIWTTLFLDFIAALVSITTYHGVTTCCGVPIFSLTFINFNWNKAIRITTYIYLAMIFAEIIPVVRRGLPFNLINPMVGFTITFAMFFDDRITEAIFMWFIEAGAIFFEFLVYRLQRKLYHDRYDKLDAVQKDLTPYISRRKLLSSSHHKRGGGRSTSQSRSLGNSSDHSSGGFSGAGGSDAESVSGHSFGDEDDVEDPAVLAANIALPSSTNHKLREARLLRERRILREKQKIERTQLHYHLAGVVINFGLICISFLLIVVIASSGGLCVRSDMRTVVFDMNQLDKCSDCRGQIVDGLCEICGEDGETMQCYYEYI